MIYGLETTDFRFLPDSYLIPLKSQILQNFGFLLKKFDSVKPNVWQHFQHSTQSLPMTSHFTVKPVQLFSANTPEKKVDPARSLFTPIVPNKDWQHNSARNFGQTNIDISAKKLQFLIDKNKSPTTIDFSSNYHRPVQEKSSRLSKNREGNVQLNVGLT